MTTTHNMMLKVAMMICGEQMFKIIVTVLQIPLKPLIVRMIFRKTSNNNLNKQEDKNLLN